GDRVQPRLVRVDALARAQRMVGELLEVDVLEPAELRRVVRVAERLAAGDVEVAADRAQDRAAEQGRARRALAELGRGDAEGDPARRVLRVHASGRDDVGSGNAGDLLGA